MPHVVLTIGAVGVALIALGLQPGPWWFGITDEQLRYPPRGSGVEWWSEAEIRRRAQHDVHLPGEWRRRFYGRLTGRTADWRRAASPAAPSVTR